MSLTRYGGLEPPESTTLTTTNATAILTGLTTYTKVVETITIVNVDTANACECTLRWVDATPTATHFWRGDIAAGETKILDTIHFPVDGKGKVRSLTAQAENANDLVVTVITSILTKQPVA